MPAKLPKKRRTRLTLTRTSEVLDVKMTAELLTVSADTVYDLFKRGELPGKKVGRKWFTTRNALLRRIESSSENNTLARAIERGDRHVITTALKSGKGRSRKGKRRLPYLLPYYISKDFPIPVTSAPQAGLI
jgi:excisionase family DNA binding protein